MNESTQQPETPDAPAHNVQPSGLAQVIEDDFKQAMRAQDAVAKMALRAVKTALTEAAKSGADHTLADADVLAVVQREAKRRREAAAEYTRFGATERAEQEQAELAVLERYLPSQLTEAEIETLAQQVIAETGATSPRDMGRVMPPLMSKIDGRGDGKVTSGVVRRLLGA